MITAVRDIDTLVKNKVSFRTNTVWSETVTDNEGKNHYIVFSYRESWPLVIYVDGFGWVGNTEKYSVTTSRHYNTATRNIGIKQKVDTEKALEIVDIIRAKQGNISDKVILNLLGVL